MLFISSFEIISIAIREAKSEGCELNICGRPDLNIFLWIAASIADTAAVIPNGIETLLVNDLSAFPIKGKRVVSNGHKSLPKNRPDYRILCNWVFDNFILAEELFAKALWSLKTCVLINNNLWGKFHKLLEWSLELPTTFDEIFKVTSVSLFIPDFNLLKCKLDNFTC